MKIRNNSIGLSVFAQVLPLLLVLLMAGCVPLQNAGQRPTISDAELALIPDAVPVSEPRSKRGNPASYEVFGRTYYVMDSADGFVQQGIASWYGPDFHGKTTSSGDLYDMYKMTAAHKTLPIPAYVRVTNLENGKSSVVRVNDRGPFIEGRIIDLSFVAAQKLGVVANGTARVEIRVLDMHGNNTSEQVVHPVHDMHPLPMEYIQDDSVLGESYQGAEVLQQPTAMLQPGKHSPSHPEQHTYYIQLGAFSQHDNADRLRNKLKIEQSHPVEVSITSTAGREFFRVRTGPFFSTDDANQAWHKLRQHYPAAKIITE